jgi:hypothetical protein
MHNKRPCERPLHQPATSVSSHPSSQPATKPGQGGRATRNKENHKHINANLLENQIAANAARHRLTLACQSTPGLCVPLAGALCNHQPIAVVVGHQARLLARLEPLTFEQQWASIKAVR